MSKNKKRQSLPSLDNAYLQKQKTFLLFAIVILSIVFVMCATYCIDEWFIESDNSNNDNIEDAIVVKYVGSAASGTTYNIWFDVVSSYNEGEVVFNPESGVILAYNNITKEQETEALESFDLWSIENYSFIWILDDIKDGDDYYTKIKFSVGDADFEIVELFVKIKDGTISFLTKDAYNKATEVNQ